MVLSCKTRVRIALNNWHDGLFFQDVLLSAQMFVLLLLSDCVRSSGVEYRGAQQISSSGLTCLNWTNATRDYDVLMHPDSQTGKQLIFTDAVKSSDKRFSSFPLWCDNVELIIHEPTGSPAQPAAHMSVFPHGISLKKTCFYCSLWRCGRSQLLQKSRFLWEALVLHHWSRRDGPETVLHYWRMHR